LYTCSIEVGVPFCCSSFSSEILSLFVIATVRPNLAINSFFRIFWVALSICETTRVFPLMSRREFRHPHVMGKIMSLSRVASHELSFVPVPLVGRLTLFGGGFSLGFNMRSSRLVWDRRVNCFDRSCWLPSSLLPSFSLPFWVGEGSSLPPRVGGGTSLPR